MSDYRRRITEPVAAVTPVDEALATACDHLRRAERVLLTSHRRPDGDGTGSMAALASLLRAQGKTAVIYSVDAIARRYKWLPLVNTTVNTISFDERFDCTIVVDCADVSLLGDTLPPPEVRGPLITLDHHASGHPFGDIAVWDPAAAAVGRPPRAGSPRVRSACGLAAAAGRPSRPRATSAARGGVVTARGDEGRERNQENRRAEPVHRASSTPR